MPVVPSIESAALATVAALATYLQRDFTAAESATAELLLDLASAAVRNYTRQHINVATTIALLAGNWTERLVLPERPVTAVGAVVLHGTTLVADVGWTWPGLDFLLRGAKAGVGAYADFGRGSSWGGPDSVVSVTYTHGWAVIPDDIREVCLALARRGMVPATAEAGVSADAETIGNYSHSTTFTADAGAVGLTAGEMALLKRYRRSTR